MKILFANYLLLMVKYAVILPFLASLKVTGERCVNNPASLALCEYYNLTPESDLSFLSTVLWNVMELLQTKTQWT